MKKIDWRWLTALIVGIALVAGIAVVIGNRSNPEPEPTPIPTVTVDPATVPITPAKDAVALKPGTIPDNGIAPPNAEAPPPDPQQYEAPIDGFGAANIQFAKEIINRGRDFRSIFLFPQDIRKIL